MIRLMRPAFLGELRRMVVLQMLDAPTLRWDNSDALGRTGSGTTWQLADSAQHDAPEMVSLSRFLAGAVHDEVDRAHPGLLPAADLMSPQVFPVRMRGRRVDPPRQRPHRDEAHDRRPLVTTIYYPEVRDVEGGDLVLFDGHGRPQRVSPRADMLVVIDGDVLHAVEPVHAGVRTSVVVNFYAVA